MRTIFFSWTVGLVGMVSIAGCGSLPFFRERPAEQTAAKNDDPAPVTVTYEDYEAGRSGHVALNPPSGSDKPWPTAPTAAKPGAVPMPRIIELNAEGKIEPPAVTLIPEIAKKIELPPDEATTTPVVKERNGFKTIAGQVQQFRKTWRLRYAPFDQDDPYGGSVMLEGVGLDRLRDGQRIRVQGVFIPPTDRFSPARYRVQTMEILE